MASRSTAAWSIPRVVAPQSASVSARVASLQGADDATLRGALEGANVPVLLALIAQFGSDTADLTDGAAVSNNDIYGLRHLSEDQQQAIRVRAFELLRQVRDGSLAVPRSIDAQAFLTAAELCVGAELSSDFLPMLTEDMGFTDSALTRVRWPGDAAPAAVAEYPVLIIGAGLSGLCMAIHLGRLGIPYALIEKNDELGGTWYENSYPDCGVDTPNHFYCYSFAPNDDWNSHYSKRDEILGYLKSVAARFGVTPCIEFDTEVVTATYDSASQGWQVATRGRDGSTDARWCRVLVSGVGQVNRPAVPALPGAEGFLGDSFHSSHWPHDVDLTGKRVAVIGTGASAMQFAPAIAAQVTSLTIYQRTPHWVRILPEYHHRVTAQTKWLLRHVPFYRNWYRLRLYWSYGDTLLETLRVDAEWKNRERSVNAQNERFRAIYEANLRQALNDREDLLAKVLPDYPVFAKRMLIDNHWCEMLQRANVELVTAGVAGIGPTDVVDDQGQRRDTDVVIYATGFQALKFLWPMQITGRDGAVLSETWGDDPRAYLGMVAPDFPNLFMLYGPNTNLAHGGSIYFHAECQARYIAQCLIHMIGRGLGAIEVDRHTSERYCAAVDAEHDQLIWANSSVGEWFKNAAGRVVCVSPWRLVDYWHMTHEPQWGDFEFEAVEARA